MFVEVFGLAVIHYIVSTTTTGTRDDSPPATMRHTQRNHIAAGARDIRSGTACRSLPSRHRGTDQSAEARWPLVRRTPGGFHPRERIPADEVHPRPGAPAGTRWARGM